MIAPGKLEGRLIDGETLNASQMLVFKWVTQHWNTCTYMAYEGGAEWRNKQKCRAGRHCANFLTDWKLSNRKIARKTTAFIRAWCFRFKCYVECYKDKNTIQDIKRLNYISYCSFFQANIGTEAMTQYPYVPCPLVPIGDGSLSPKELMGWGEGWRTR